MAEQEKRFGIKSNFPLLNPKTTYWVGKRFGLCATTFYTPVWVVTLLSRRYSVQNAHLDAFSKKSIALKGKKKGTWLR